MFINFISIDDISLSLKVSERATDRFAGIVEHNHHGVVAASNLPYIGIWKIHQWHPTVQQKCSGT